MKLNISVLIREKIQCYIKASKFLPDSRNIFCPVCYIFHQSKYIACYVCKKSSITKYEEIYYSIEDIL